MSKIRIILWEKNINTNATYRILNITVLLVFHSSPKIMRIFIAAVMSEVETLNAANHGRKQLKMKAI